MENTQYTSLIKTKEKEWKAQPMLRPKIGSIKINMSLGKSGNALTRGIKILEDLTGQKPVEVTAKLTWRKWGIRKGQSVGAKVTVRGASAYKLLMRLFHAKNYKLNRNSIDGQGNFSFGINEHIDIPDMKYDPNLGIIGFNVVIQMERAGYRVKRRKYLRTSLPKKHHVSPEDSIVFLTSKYLIEIS